MDTRLPGLDLLRFVAVTLVLGRHFVLPEGMAAPGSGGGFMVPWQRGGWVGVDLFFVLSGFLVSGLLFREHISNGDVSITRFYLRRWWRIYPPFLLLIVITVLARATMGRVALDARNVGVEIFFLQSYFTGLWSHTWSLGVEEHFYLLLPLLLLPLLRAHDRSGGSSRHILALVVVEATTVLAFRFLTWHFQPSFAVQTHVFPSHLRMDSLFFGVAISYAYHFHREWFVATLAPWRRPLLVLGVAALLPAFLLPLSDPFISTLGFTLFYLGSGLLVAGAVLPGASSSAPVRLMIRLGAYSYSIYLWHLPVLVLVERLGASSPGSWLRLVTYLFGSFVVGVVAARGIELPTLRLRDRWFPSLVSPHRVSVPSRA